MKKTLTLTILICFYVGIMAQEKVKQTETGFIFSNLDKFGLSLKKGNNQSMWRFNTLLIDAGKNEIPSDTTIYRNLGVGISLGREVRKTLNENFEFSFGFDLSYAYNQSKISKKITRFVEPYTQNKTNEFGFNFVIGTSYIIKNQLVIGIEILPGVSSHITKTTISDGLFNETVEKQVSKGYNLGFTNNSARLTVAYRFRK